MAAIMAGMLVMSFLVSLTSCRTILRELDKTVKGYYYMFAVITFLSFNSIGLCFIICKRRLRHVVSVVDQYSSIETTSSSWRQRAQTAIPLAGLFVFLLGILVMELAKTASFVTCLVKVHECYDRIGGYVGTIYHIVKCTFCICVFVFICVYSLSKYRLHSSCMFLRYLLCLLAACMLYLYYDLEAWVFASYIYNEHCKLDAKLLTPAEQCGCFKTTLFNLAYDIEDQLAPFYVEFFLLATERVLHMFSAIKTDDVDANTGVQYVPFTYVHVRPVCVTGTT